MYKNIYWIIFTCCFIFHICTSIQEQQINVDLIIKHFISHSLHLPIVEVNPNNANRHVVLSVASTFRLFASTYLSHTVMLCTHTHTHTHTATHTFTYIYTYNCCLCTISDQITAIATKLWQWMIKTRLFPHSTADSTFYRPTSATRLCDKLSTISSLRPGWQAASKHSTGAVSMLLTVNFRVSVRAEATLKACKQLAITKENIA